MDVRMPDGTIVTNVPEGTTKAQLMQKLGKAEEPKESSFLDFIKSEFAKGPGARDITPEQRAGLEKAEIEARETPIASALFGGPIPPKAAVKDAPIIGATIASMAAPPLALPALAAKSPLLASFLSQVITKAPAAAVAGGGGGIVEKAITEPEATLPEIGQAGLQSAKEMGLAEVAGAGALTLGQKALAPVAGKITEKGAQLLKFAKEKKLPFLPSRITGSTATKAIEGGTDSILGGRLVNTAYRKLMVTRFNQVADEIPKQVGDVLGNQVIAKQTRQEFGDLVMAATTEAKTRATNFLQTIPKGGNAANINLSNFKPLLKRIQAQTKSPAMKRYVTDELEQIGRNITKRAEDLETSMRQLSGVRAKGADRKFLTEMREAIKSDFGAAGGNMKLLGESNEFFRRNKALLSSKTGRRLATREGRAGFIPDRAVTVEIFRSGNEGLVKQLSEELPEQTWRNLKAQNISNMLDGATTDVPEMFGLKFINGNKLKKILTNNRSVFEATYDKQTMKALDNLADLAEATAPEIRELVGKGGLAEMRKFGAIGSVVGGAVDPFTGLILPQGASIGFAQSLMNPNGVLKKWLTTGIKIPKAAKEGLKVGGRLAFDNGN